MHALGELLWPGDSTPFHWANPTAARLLSVSLLRASADRADDHTEALRCCDWSCAFPIDAVGDFTIGIKPPDLETRRQRLFLNVDVQASGAETRVVFSLQESSLAPYRIDNLTNHSILVAQSPCTELEHPRVVEEVPPGAKAPFAWEQVTDRPTLDVHVANARHPVCLDDLQLQGTMSLAPPPPPPPPPPTHAPTHPHQPQQPPHALRPHAANADFIRFRMSADGPIKVLLLLPAHDGPLPRESSSATAADVVGGGGGASAADDDGRIRRSLTVSFAAIGLSLVDSTPRELLFLSLRSLQLSASSSRQRSSVALSVANIQVDNQLPSAVFPVLLRPFGPTRRSRPSPATACRTSRPPSTCASASTLRRQGFASTRPSRCACRRCT